MFNEMQMTASRPPGEDGGTLAVGHVFFQQFFRIWMTWRDLEKGRVISSLKKSSTGSPKYATLSEFSVSAI